ncbi:centromere protein V-like [Hydractinia symbiolongicarpus]|uniref:centromere protein V-like n=1 Tax=Hydractinia symbiolongicarpus TaxID=13093 RepID=UPI00254BC44E|nr:centromere protein V-like [Hydractinia symbiolongicarpus]
MNVLHHGGCHCGKIKYQVVASSILECVNCNCSVCYKKQNIHFIVPKDNFKLLQGKDDITTYTFNTHQAKHTFCKVCGVQSFYFPRSNPDGVGVMPHCLDQDTVKEIKILDFDGQNWEKTMQSAKGEELKKKSKM